MGREDLPAAGIEATTAQLKDRVRQAAAVFEGTLPGADAYKSSATTLFRAADDLLAHEAEIPKLQAGALLASRVRTGQWAGGLMALWAAGCIATVPLGWTRAWWLVLLIPMLLFGAVAALTVGGAKEPDELRVPAGVAGFAGAALGSLLLLTHAVSAWWLDLPVLALAGLGLWAFLLGGEGVSQ